MREEEWNEEELVENSTGGIPDDEIDSIQIKLDDYDMMESEPESVLGEEELFASLNDSLRRQVEEIDEAAAREQVSAKAGSSEGEASGKMSKKKKVLVIIGSIFLVIVLAVAFLVGTNPGQKLVIKFVAYFIDHSVDHPDILKPVTPRPVTPGVDPTTDPDNPDDEGPDVTSLPLVEQHLVRKEEYVKNFLIFGIDQGDMDAAHAGSLNTDTMMIASINTKDQTVKLTSILRDMYVELEDGKGRKLNSVYARGVKSGQGPELLMSTIEKYYRIDLEGYAYVKIASFEKIVDLLGGVSIKISKEEADYLNKTNYITNPKNRNLVAGTNHMNGNQVLGYCRIRKVATIGGAANDYGRALRQRRVLQAIFEKYKSKNVFDLLSITQKCLSYISTDVTADQIEELLNILVYSGITTMESFRLPINDSFHDSGTKGYNGVTYGLVVDDMRANILYLFENLYADTPEAELAEYEERKSERNTGITKESRRRRPRQSSSQPKFG
ncbi:MAG: LCP family protein, partial [Lachnospiraceae bacterium]|nr:LCP family protein [Lachnospiraceae bacterium]